MQKRCKNKPPILQMAIERNYFITNASSGKSSFRKFHWSEILGHFANRDGTPGQTFKPVVAKPGRMVGLFFPFSIPFHWISSTRTDPLQSSRVCLRCFRDPIRVPRIENDHRVHTIRENRVPKIKEIGFLQVHLGTQQTPFKNLRSSTEWLHLKTIVSCNSYFCSWEITLRKHVRFCLTTPKGIDHT